MKSTELTLQQFFPFGTSISRRFLELVSLVYPLKSEDIFRFKKTWDYDCLMLNSNIHWSKDLLLSVIDNISFDNLLKMNLLWDVVLLKVLESKINEQKKYSYDPIINLSNQNTFFSFKDYLFIKQTYTNIRLDISMLYISIDELDEYRQSGSEIWETLSESKTIPWNYSLINKYKSFWHWKKLCSNASIKWTFEMLIEFKDLLDWDKICVREDICWTIPMLSSFRKTLRWSDNFLQLFISQKNYGDKQDQILFYSFRSEVEKCIESMLKYQSFHEFYYKHPEFRKLLRIYHKTHTLKAQIRYFSSYPNAFNYENKSIFNENLYYSLEYFRKYKTTFPIDFFREISKAYNVEWTIELLEEFYISWNWDELSQNPHLPWSDTLLLKFKDKLNWKILSGSNFLKWSIELIEEYKDRWDWDKLSGNESVNWSATIISRFKHRISWLKLSSNPSIQWDIDIFTQFIDKWVLSNQGCYKYETYKDYGMRDDLNTIYNYPFNFFNDFIFKYFTKDQVLDYLEKYETEEIYYPQSHTYSLENDRLLYRVSNKMIERVDAFFEEDVFTFGKFKGKEIRYANEHEHEYILWCIENVDFFSIPEELFIRIANKYTFSYSTLSAQKVKYIDRLEFANRLKWHEVRDDHPEYCDRETEEDRDEFNIDSAFDGDEDAYYIWKMGH